MARPEGFEPPTPRFVVWCSLSANLFCRVIPEPTTGNDRSLPAERTHNGHATQGGARRRRGGGRGDCGAQKSVWRSGPLVSAGQKTTKTPPTLEFPSES